MVKAAGKETQATRVKQLLAGINKHFTDASAKLTVGSVTYTVAQLTSLLQSFVDIRAATDAAKAAASARVLAETAQAPPLRDAIAALPQGFAPHPSLLELRGEVQSGARASANRSP